MVNETKSKIPPRTLAKIERLPREDRRIYIAKLIADYEAKRCNLEAIAGKMASYWLGGQDRHLRSCINQLNSLLDD